MSDELERRLRAMYASLDPGAPADAVAERIRSGAAGPASRAVRPAVTPFHGWQIAVAVVAALVLAGAGLLLAGALEPSPLVPASPRATATVSATIPRPSSTPASTVSGLPSGARVIDGAWQIGAHADGWSPDGRYLAVARADQAGSGLVDVFDPDGIFVTAFKSTDSGWVDSSHLATLWRPNDGSFGGSVTVHTLDGRPDVAVPGTWAGILPNRHGVLLLAVPNGGDPPVAFRIWTGGLLGPVMAGSGDPMAWSPDGQLLALESNVTYGGGTGGSISADLRVLRFPAAAAVPLTGDIHIDGHATPVFSPDDTLVLTGSVDSARPAVHSLTGAPNSSVQAAGTATGWAPDGRLIVAADDGSVQLWSPLDDSVTPGPPDLLAFGPSMDDVARSMGPAAGTPAVEVATAFGSVTLTAEGPVQTATWTPDGRAVFVAVGSSGNTGSVEPLVWLPAPGVGTAHEPTPSPSSALVPPGAKLLLSASSIQRLLWAPDRAHVAAVAAGGGALGVWVLDLAGDVLATYSASRVSWLDAAHLVTFQLVAGPGPGTGAVTIHEPGGGRDEVIPGQWDDALADGHGSIVLVQGVSGAYQNDRFQIWHGGQLGPVIGGHGAPFAWSADGHDLALEMPSLTVQRSGLVLANVGGPVPASVSVMRFPDAVPIGLPTDAFVDDRSPLLFSPDDHWLAGDGADQQGPVVYDLTTGRAVRIPLIGRPIGWTPDGRLIIDHFDGTARLWAPGGGLTDPALGGLPFYGPTMDDVIVVPGLQAGAGTIVVRTPSGSISIPTSTWGESAPVAWTSDGRSVLLTIAAASPSTDDLLVLVPAP